MADQIDLVHLRQEREHAFAMAKHHSDAVDKLLEQYGSGVRPGWVSAEVSIAGAHRDNWLDKAAALDEQIAEITTN